MSLKWYFNGSPISGATSSNLPVSNIQASQVGAYTIVASNSYASVSNTVYLTMLTNAPGSVVAPSGLVDWWPCDGTPVDIVTSSRSGTPAGAFSYVSGYPGRAFHFDGSTAYISTGASSQAVPWTICFWVNRQNAPGTAAALCGDGDAEIKLEQYNGTRQLGFTIFTVADYNFGYSVPQNAWTHVAIVASGSGASAQMQLYANGSPVGTAIATNRPCPRAYFGAGYIGASHGTARVLDYMLGNVDELMIFNRALSASEISTLSAAGPAGLVRAPEITGIQRISSTQSQLSLRGLTARNFTVYRSSDLLTWSTVASFGNPNGALQYTTPAATNDFQIYRVSQP
jgi:hypothetical protein